MKIIIFSLCLIGVLALIKKVFNLGYRDNIVYFLPFFLFFSFDFGLSDRIYRIVGENLKLYINSITIILIIFLVFVLNRGIIKNGFKFIYLFFLILLINIIISIFCGNIVNLPMFLRLFFNYFTIFICFLIACCIENISLDKILYSFNYLSVMNGLLGILQIITKKTLLIGSFDSSILYTQGVVNVNRAVGIAGSNNSGGNLGALLFAITFYNTLKKKDIFSIVSCLLTLLFTFLTQTRVALLAIFVCAFIMISPFKNKKSIDLKKLLFVCFSLIISIVSVVVFWGKLYTTFFVDRGNTANSRFIQYTNAWNTAIRDHFWLGVGSGQWRTYLYNSFNIVDIPIHSMYFNYWVENGFLLFIVNIIFNLGILCFIVKRKNIGKDTKNFFIGFFVANLIVSNFNPNELYTINLVVYYFVAFLLVTIRGNILNKQNFTKYDYDSRLKND